jgi:hypothetical protein
VPLSTSGHTPDRLGELLAENLISTRLMARSGTALHNQYTGIGQDGIGDAQGAERGLGA